tara:strand:- start:173 stop:445 length:273 start_codon:yes stop_codon:yes gene_type:complete
MSLTKETFDDKIEIVGMDGWDVLQIRTATVVKDDGKEISRTFQRRVINPVDDISSENDKIKAIANLYFTDDAKTAYTTAANEVTSQKGSE